MTPALEQAPHRRAALSLPSMRSALLLSVLLHALLLGKWLPQVRLPSLDELTKGDTSRSLEVTIAQPPSAPARPQPPVVPAPVPESAPVMEARPVPPARPRAPRPKPPPRPPAAPPVLALNRPSPEPALPAAPGAPARSVPADDLSSYIEAQRRARAEAAPPARPAARAPAVPPVDDEATRADRAVVANLGLNRAPSFGPDATRIGGGIFQVKRVGYSDAEFLFYGWNKDIRRNTTQLVEVSKGDASDIRVAVVRRMIAIIREYEQGDFLWESPRLGRNVTLSARMRDNAGLEDFMMSEFFGER